MRCTLILCIIWDSIKTTSEAESSQTSLLLSLAWYWPLASLYLIQSFQYTFTMKLWSLESNKAPEFPDKTYHFINFIISPHTNIHISIFLGCEFEQSAYKVNVYRFFEFLWIIVMSLWYWTQAKTCPSQLCQHIFNVLIYFY